MLACTARSHSQFRTQHLGGLLKPSYKVNRAPRNIPNPAPNMAEKCSLLLLNLAAGEGHSTCVCERMFVSE